jgi:hypothetical protein
MMEISSIDMAEEDLFSRMLLVNYLSSAPSVWGRREALLLQSGVGSNLRQTVGLDVSELR